MGTGTHVRARRRAETAIDSYAEEAMAMIDVDAERAQEFAERMLGTMNGAMLTLTSIEAIALEDDPFSINDCAHGR
jgi:hypothetical protein